MYDQKVVRLKKGDYNALTIYHDDPFEQAREFERDGAKWVHMVDLEGAKTGHITTIDILKKVKKATSLRIQFGGGIRDVKTIYHLLEIGVDHIVLGSFALKQPEVLKTLCETYRDQLVVAVDVKNGYVTYHGWLEQSTYALNDYLVRLIDLGVKKVLITDISKDGMLQGIDISYYKQLKKTYKDLEIIASGGVTTLEDIEGLNQASCDGVIVGVALYEKKFSLKEALSCSNEESFHV